MRISAAIKYLTADILDLKPARALEAAWLRRHVKPRKWFTCPPVRGIWPLSWQLSSDCSNRCLLAFLLLWAGVYSRSPSSMPVPARPQLHSADAARPLFCSEHMFEDAEESCREDLVHSASNWLSVTVYRTLFILPPLPCLNKNWDAPQSSCGIIFRAETGWC